MKVLHVVPDFANGGIEGVVYNLVRQQCLEGMDVAVLCCQARSSAAHLRMENTGARCLYVDLAPFDLHPGKYKEILRICSQYELMHLHLFKPVLAFILKLCKVPKIFTIHSSGDVKRPMSRLYRLKNWLLVRHLNRDLQCIVSNSEFTRSFWRSRGVCYPQHDVVYNGVPIMKTPSRENALEAMPELAGKFIIGTSSRFIAWKRTEVLIRAFARMRQGGSDVVLLLVGDGPMMAYLRKITDELGVVSRVHFSGYRKNVEDFQDIMDVCVFPSAQEPFGLVAVECLALGKPVYVMCDGGGIVEIVRPLNENMVANSENDLTEMLDRAVESRFALKEGAEERMNVARRFSIEKCAASYHSIYEKVLRRDE